MDTNKKIGCRIKDRRRQLGLSQEQLGNMLNLNKSTIQRYESGEIKNIKMPVLHMLADVLMVNPNWLALESNKMSALHKKTDSITSYTNVVPSMAFDGKVKEVHNNPGFTRTYDIIAKIKNRRMELGFSFQDLARKTGLSKSTLQRYETGGIKNIPLDKLETLADALEVTPKYILGWEDTDSYKNIENSKEEYIIKNFRKLNTEGQNKLIDYSDDLVISGRYKKSSSKTSEKQA